MKVEINLCGGLEILFDGKTNFPVEIEDGSTVGVLINEMKTHHLKERQELFMQEETVRPGIIVMVNDTDW